MEYINNITETFNALSALPFFEQVLFMAALALIIFAQALVYLALIAIPIIGLYKLIDWVRDHNSARTSFYNP